MCLPGIILELFLPQIGSWVQEKEKSIKTRQGADYGSDHEILNAKFRLEGRKENH